MVAVTSYRSFEILCASLINFVRWRVCTGLGAGTLLTLLTEVFSESDRDSKPHPSRPAGVEALVWGVVTHALTLPCTPQISPGCRTSQRRPRAAMGSP